MSKRLLGADARIVDTTLDDNGVIYDIELTFVDVLDRERKVKHSLRSKYNDLDIRISYTAISDIQILFGVIVDVSGPRVIAKLSTGQTINALTYREHDLILGDPVLLVEHYPQGLSTDVHFIALPYCYKDKVDMFKLQSVNVDLLSKESTVFRISADPLIKRGIHATSMES